MKSAKLSSREKKDVSVTVRLKPSTVEKLKKIAKINDLSVTSVIEQLIEGYKYA